MFIYINELNKSFIFRAKSSQFLLSKPWILPPWEIKNISCVKIAGLSIECSVEANGYIRFDSAT